MISDPQLTACSQVQKRTDGPAEVATAEPESDGLPVEMLQEAAAWWKSMEIGARGAQAWQTTACGICGMLLGVWTDQEKAEIASKSCRPVRSVCTCLRGSAILTGIAVEAVQDASYPLFRRWSADCCDVLPGA